MTTEIAGYIEKKEDRWTITNDLNQVVDHYRLDEFSEGQIIREFESHFNFYQDVTGFAGFKFRTTSKRVVVRANFE